MRKRKFQHKVSTGGRKNGRRVTKQPLRPALGSAPGIEHMPEVRNTPSAGLVKIRYTCYSREMLESWTFESSEGFLAFTPPEWAEHHWIDVVGIHPHTIHQLAKKFNIHSLAAEDVVNIPQRAKVENYEEGLFIVQRMLILEAGNVCEEQVSFWMHENHLFTFQERNGDVWNPVRHRLGFKASRMRLLGVPYLLYALIDAIVDQLFPILENFEEPLQKLETQIMETPTQEVQKAVYAIRRELAYLKLVIWPLRETIDVLHRNLELEIPDEIQAYFRDIYDHAIQANELLESYRDMTVSLNEFCINSSSERMNEIMKVLTIMSSCFIPLTFFAGVYGMNFQHMPEIPWKYSYPLFWLICIGVVAGLITFFRRRKWI